MFFELREYRTKPGRRENWVRDMEEEIIPFQSSRSMVMVGSLVSPDEDDLYVWNRRFEDEADKERLYEAVYESDTWKDKIAPSIPDMLDRDKIVVRRISPTPKSVFR